MFCTGCGTEMTNDSSFCSNCGTQISGERVAEKPKEYNQIITFAKEIIKNPIKGTKELRGILTDKMLLIYFSIGILLTTLVVTININFEAEAFKEIFKLVLIGLFLFYLSVGGIVLLFDLIINKSKKNIMDYVLVASVAITIQLLLSSITLLVYFVSAILTILILVSNLFIISFILYRGYSEVVGKENIFVFVFGAILTVSFIIANYTVLKIIYENVSSSLRFLF